MQSKKYKVLAYTPFIAWLCASLVLFLYISRIGFVQIVDVTNWEAFWSMTAYIQEEQFMRYLVIALTGAVLFSLSCVSLGLFFLQNCIQTKGSIIALGVTAFLVGEIIYSTLFLSMIRLFRLSPAFVGTILLLGLICGLPALKLFTTRLLGCISLPKVSGFAELIISILIGIGFLISLAFSATRLGYDATAYYFSHSKVMALTQMPVFFHPNDSFVVSSFHPGILFTAIIQLFGDQSARLLSWINGIAILLLGLSIGGELGLPRRAYLWFSALMVSTTAYFDLLGDGKIELISTAPLLAAVYWMLRAGEQPTKGTYILIGFLSGFAIISRPYNIFLASVFIVLFLISQIIAQHRQGHFQTKDFIFSQFWMMLPLFGLGTFHLYQNWIWLGSPIAPLIYARQLGGNDWQWAMDPAKLNLYRISYPLTVTFSNSQQSLGNISPLALGFLPFLLIASVRKNLYFPERFKSILVVSLLTLAAWIILFFTVLEIRYVLFLWVIFFLATAQVIDSAIFHGKIPLLRPLIAVFLATMCLRAFVIASISYFPIDNNQLPYCPDSQLCKFMETLNRSADPGDRVFVLHAYRYYLREDLFACSSQGYEYHDLEKLTEQNSSDFWTVLFKHNFRFIMFEKNLSEEYYRFGKLPSIDTVPNWMEVKLLYSNPNQTQQIYKIDAINPPIVPEVSCQQNSQGVWQLTR